MKKGSRWLQAITGVIFSASVLFSINAFAAGKQSFTGEVGDAMCGRQHMEGSAADCTRACVAKGSKFALVVGEKIYVLEHHRQGCSGHARPAGRQECHRNRHLGRRHHHRQFGRRQVNELTAT